MLQEQLEQKQLRITRIEQEQQGSEVDRARRVALALEAVQSKLRGLTGQVQQRLAFLSTQDEDAPPAHRVTPAAVTEAQDECTRLESQIPEYEARWGMAQQETRSAQAALDAIDEQIAEQSELVSQHDLRLSQLRGQVAAAQNTLQAIEEEVERRALAVTQANERSAVAARELETFEAHPDHVTLREQRSAEGHNALEESYRDAQERQAAAERTRDDTRERLHDLERERSGLDAQIRALSSSLEQRDASHVLLQQAAPGIVGRVADALRIADGYESAVGLALGQLADAVLVESGAAAIDAVASARTEDLGRLLAVLTSEFEDAEGPQTSAGPVPPPGLQRLADVILEAPPGIRQLLSRSFVAEDLKRALAARHVFLSDPGDPRDFTMVTPSGEVLTRFTLSGGSELSPSRVELAAQLEQARTRHTTVAALITDLTAQLEQHSVRAMSTKTLTHEAFTELRDSDAALAAFEKERNRLFTRVEASRAEAERAVTALESVQGNTQDARHALSAAERTLLTAESQPRPILDATQREDVAADVETRRQAELETRLHLETLRERSRAARSHAAAVAEQLEAERAAAEASARRAVLRRRQTARAEHVSTLLPRILDACDQSLHEARAAQQLVEQARAQQTQELTLLRAEEADLRTRLQALTERVHGSELKSYERKLQLSGLLERAGQELGLVEDVLLAEYGPDQPIPVYNEDAAVQFASELERELAAECIPFHREEQERRLAAAERKLAALGRINPLALEEFAALEQRHQFLVEQLEDLTQTRQDLLAIISELDDKMEGIFEGAFVDTQRAFAEVFPILFPGGAGEITLSDPDDLLATGIDIAVRPAGKKVERLSLLSGGERSLAAVAWLIAIFQARPSPFYIMDEVEAALDDANLGRLLQVFEQLRTHSQLIVITHQKRTMEIADALYGVSMRKDGISAVVGQRLAREESIIV